jgi:hypothetical protein
MESPFENENQTFVLYLEPILNNYHKTYQNIITVNKMPAGPISRMVKTISSPKLSRFQQAGPFNEGFGCMHALLRYPNDSANASVKNVNNYMLSEDIPSVFSYLQRNGYTIDTTLTNMLLRSKLPMVGVSEDRISGNRKMICMVKYNSV